MVLWYEIWGSGILPGHKAILAGGNGAKSVNKAKASIHTLWKANKGGDQMSSQRFLGVGVSDYKPSAASVDIGMDCPLCPFCPPSDAASHCEFHLQVKCHG